MRNPAEVQVGVDLGGTGTRVVAVRDGEVLAAVDRRSADLGEGAMPLRMDRLADLVHSVVPDGSPLRSVGVGASGPVDVRDGTIHNPDTLPWFSGFRFVHELTRRVGVSVTIDNDADAAALGEFRSGAGRGSDRLLVVTLGTGVGTAFLLDGRPVRGRDGAHPEGGHLPVWSGEARCYCGLAGCWEPSASRTRLQHDLAEVLGTTAHKELLTLASDVATERADVRQVFVEYGRAVGRGLATLHAIHQPRVTTLGGSASTCFALFQEGVQEALHRTPEFDVPVELRVAQLGDNAGALGAATGLG